MKGIGTIAALLIPAMLGAAAAGEAQSPPSAQAAVASAPGKVAGAATAQITAKVVAVDPAQRTVTLQGSSGKTRTIEVSDQVRNFDQIKVGDTVHAKYTRAVALEVKKGAAGMSAPTEEHAITPAPAPGAKPGGTIARKITATVEVLAVNHAKNMVTLRGPQGDEVDVQAEDPSQLQNIKKGDHVQVTYVEALAISVREATAPK